MTDRVYVFDTTLRDGEQSPGASMTSREKLDVARGLSRLGVDVIEAGFPAASPDDLEAVRRIAREVGHDPRRAEPPIICGLARAKEGDLRAAAEAVRDAARPRIHTFLATSPIHRERKLSMSPDEVVEAVRVAVARARELVDDVEFSAEDAMRTEPTFLCRVFEAAIEAGATTINLPDTVGYATPIELDRRVRTVRANVRGMERVRLSVHCHDDLGMGTANTLAAVAAGARQVEVTINGVGERAGNTALEEVVMALHTRPTRFGVTTGIDTTELYRMSRLVSAVTGMLVQPNKAIVGANAFAHEAGIHQDGMLKDSQTYEIMRPETVGVHRSELVLGKHSGRHALRARLEELGEELDDEALDALFVRFKALADQKKRITNADLLALNRSRTEPAPTDWSIASLQVACGTTAPASATVKLAGPDGLTRVETTQGTGPVDACFRAIDALLGVTPKLLAYHVHAVTAGLDALGEVSVQVRSAAAPSDERPFHGYGADNDVVVASARAYLAALNRMIASSPGERAQPGERKAS